jgi:hypothetical protein
MGGGSRSSAPPPPPPPPAPPKPVDVAPARTEAEKAASFKKARRGRSAGLMSSTASETLGTDTTLGAS